MEANYQPLIGYKRGVFIGRGGKEKGGKRRWHKLRLLHRLYQTWLTSNATSGTSHNLLWPWLYPPSPTTTLNNLEKKLYRSLSDKESNVSTTPTKQYNTVIQKIFCSSLGNPFSRLLNSDKSQYIFIVNVLCGLILCIHWYQASFLYCMWVIVITNRLF